MNHPLRRRATHTIAYLPLVAAIGIIALSIIVHQAHASIRFVPDYEMTLTEVVVSTRITEANLELQEPLIEALPSYSAILALVADSAAEELASWLIGREYSDRVRIIEYPTSYAQSAELYLVSKELDSTAGVRYEEPKRYPPGTTWTQDLFEPVRSNRGIRLIVPDVYKYYYSAESSDDVYADNAFLSVLSSDVDSIARSNTVFSGGNFVVDRVSGRNILFCGSDVIKTTRMDWQLTSDRPSDDTSVKDAIAASLAADEVVVFGNEGGQPPIMFHLDQAFVLLGDRRAGVTRIVGEASPGSVIADVQKFLHEIRTTLADRGYRTIDLLTTIEQATQEQFAANAIVYTDRSSGKRGILLPVFDNPSIDQRNIDALESIDLRVIPVHTHAFERNGGIHCLVNVLR